MSGKRVKVNIFDINDDLHDDLEFVQIIETARVEEPQDDEVKVKIEIEEVPEVTKDETTDVEYNKHINYKRHRCVHPTLDKISRIVDENKEDLKENLGEIKSRGLEKGESFDKIFDRQRERVDRISDFSKNVVDEVFLSSDSFINWIKYERTKDEGREIKVEKKE